MKAKKEEFVRCYKRVCESDGCVIYYNDFEVAIALKLPRSQTVVDLRTTPPFLPISPCPYCGTHNDRGHNPLKHIDHTLGVVPWEDVPIY